MKIFSSLMDWVWRVAANKGAIRVLALVSFLEAIFFPIPPDVFIIPMGLAKREAVFRLAGTALLFSLLGGVAGYFIGYFFMDAVGMRVMEFYGFQEKYIIIQDWYRKYDAWAVAVAGLTPIPYKLCTLTAGAFKINFWVFLLASTISRGVRFFAIAGLIYLFGEKIRFFLEKRLDLVLIVLMVLGVLGFVALKYL